MKKVNSGTWSHETSGQYMGPPDDYKYYKCVFTDIQSPHGQKRASKMQESEISSTSNGTDFTALDLRTHERDKEQELSEHEQSEALDLRTNVKKGIPNDACSNTKLNNSGRMVDLRKRYVLKLKGSMSSPDVAAKSTRIRRLSLLKRILKNKQLRMKFIERWKYKRELNKAENGSDALVSKSNKPRATIVEYVKEMTGGTNSQHCVPDVNIEHATANGYIVLDIGDELNPDFLDDLLDSVLNEIKAKQNIDTKDPDDQIMPSASPDIFDTELMDDLDTPFHQDHEDQSFISHKQPILSPDQFPENWSVDYVEEFSRRNSIFDNQCSQTIEKVCVSAYSYSEINRAGVAADCAMTLKNAEAASSNSVTHDNSGTQAECHIPSHVFEYHGNRGDCTTSKDDDTKQTKSYHSLVQVPDLEALYTESMDRMDTRVNSNEASHSHLEAKLQQQRCQQNIVQASVYQDENSNDTCGGEFLSWTCKHPDNWNETEVLDWLFYSADRNGIDTTNLHGESFRLTGRELCRMGIEEFQRREPQYGHYFYSWFRQLLNGLTFTQPSDMVVNNEPSILIPNERYDQRFLDNSFSPGSHDPDDLYYQHQASSPASPEDYYQSNQRARNFNIEYGSVYPSHPVVDNQLYQGFDYSPACPPEQVQANQQDYVYNYSTQSCQISDKHASSGTYGPMKTEKTSPSSVTSKYAGVLTPRRRPGRPRIKSLPTEEEKRLRLEKKMKSQHLWEFIFDLLNNPAYNPQVLKWENPKEGVFRFIQSETIAGLWGDLKNNENMTYEKLSRAMRHYYKRGILERVEGRRLVYKFSISTLKRLREKHMPDFQTPTTVATISNINTQYNTSTKQMKSSTKEISTRVPISSEQKMVFNGYSPDDVVSASGRSQYMETNYAPAHELTMGYREPAHFQGEMTSRDLTDLSDIGFHNPIGKHTGVLDMTKSFHAPTDLTMQNLENKSISTLPYL